MLHCAESVTFENGCNSLHMVRRCMPAGRLRLCRLDRSCRPGRVLALSPGASENETRVTRPRMIVLFGLTPVAVPPSLAKHCPSATSNSAHADNCMHRLQHRPAGEAAGGVIHSPDSRTQTSTIDSEDRCLVFFFKFISWLPRARAWRFFSETPLACALLL